MFITSCTSCFTHFLIIYSTLVMCHFRIDSHVVHNNCILVYIYIHLLYKHWSGSKGFVVREPKINQFLSHVKIVLHINQ